MSTCMLEHSHGGAGAYFMVCQLATHALGGGTGEPRRRYLWGTRRGRRAVVSACMHAIGAVGSRESPAGGTSGAEASGGR